MTDSDTAKRPKLEAQQSTASSGTASSGASQHGDPPTGRVRVGSSASSTSHWATHDGHPSPQLSSLTKSIVAHGISNSQDSPTTTSTPTIPGYRDSIFNGSHQTPPWRESHVDDNVIPAQWPRIAKVGDRRSSYSASPNADLPSLTGSLQHSHRTGQGDSCPLLSPGSSAGISSGSSGSSSSSFYTPRTPMEPSLDRALHIPSLYSHKSSGSFDNHLPPLRPHSSSPQTSMLGSQPPSNGMLQNGVRPLLLEVSRRRTCNLTDSLDP